MTILRFITLLLLFLLGGCAGLPEAQTQRVGDRQLEFVAHVRSAPVVVFENGLGARMDWWSKVLPAIQNDASYFAYNRPGYGNSTPAETPRDGAHIVEELRADLRSLGLPPPYVLVGHSLGGLYMQLFARKHPQEVAALILVDSTHPRQLEGSGAMENQSLWVRSALKVLVIGTAKAEFDLIAQTGEQVLGLPTLSGAQVFVLNASGDLQETSAAARFANEKRQDLVHLYPGSKQVWVESGHAIPLEKPEDVVDAIRSALAEARSSQQSPHVP
ncbi:MAG: alpha/beta fold hydrolase [Proteobacteria bacterium]|nr:alpha/beta fold hydrolase [Pseudomonadota bacterium]